MDCESLVLFRLAMDPVGYSDQTNTITHVVTVRARPSVSEQECSEIEQCSMSEHSCSMPEHSCSMSEHCRSMSEHSDQAMHVTARTRTHPQNVYCIFSGVLNLIYVRKRKKNYFSS